MVKITVCDGPWCGASSADTVRAFETELKKQGLDQYTEVITSYCMGACKHGPCVRIDGVKHFHVEERLIPALIQSAVLPLIEK